MQLLCAVLCLLVALEVSTALPLVPYSKVQERENREVDSHDYILTLFGKRRSFIDANCNATFNGFPVSQHICKTKVIKSFLASTPDAIDKYTCDIDFSISLSVTQGEQVIGADLALYKLGEVGSGERRYMVYVARTDGSGFPHTPIAYGALSSRSHGWQLFNIDTEAKKWPTGVTKLSVKVIVTDSNGTVLPCNPLFVVSNLPEQRPEMQKTSNSTSRTTESPPSDPANYVPTITVFAVTRTQQSPLCSSQPEFCNTVHRDRTTPPPENDRESRDTDEHNYVQTIFAERQSLKATNCTQLFNGQPVSPLHCNRNAKLKFTFGSNVAESSDIESLTCNTNFAIKISRDDRLLGADLVLYKSSNESSDIIYWVFIIEQVTAVFNDLITDKFISGSQSGWVTFHINNVATWPAGTSNFVIGLLAYKFEGDDLTMLSCEEMSSVFSLPPMMEGSGFAIGSEGEGYSELNFVPVVTAFVETEKPIFPNPSPEEHPRASSNPFRLERSVETSTPLGSKEGIPAEWKNCRLEDRTIDLQELFQEDIKVLPKKVNVRRCATDRVGQRGPEEGQVHVAASGMQCLPTKYSNLEVLVQTATEYRIESIPGVVIEDCGYAAT